MNKFLKNRSRVNPILDSMHVHLYKYHSKSQMIGTLVFFHIFLIKKVSINKSETFCPFLQKDILLILFAMAEIFRIKFT